MSEKLTPGDALLKQLDDMEQAGMAITKEWTGMWNESLRYFFSDQLHSQRQHKNWDWIVLNYIWPSAIQEIAKLSKNEPKIIAHPWEESDIQASDAWQAILQWLWEKGVNTTGMRLEQIAAILDGKLFGYRVSKVFWEDKVEWDGEKWLGDVKYRLWHPTRFWALGEEKIEDDACGTVRFMELEKAKKLYPKFKKQLEEEADQFKEPLGFGGDHIRGQLASVGTYPSAGQGGIDRGADHLGTNLLLDRILRKSRRNLADTGEKKDDKQFVKISEYYFFDHKEVKEREDEDIPVQELISTGQIIEQNGSFFRPDGEPATPDDFPTRTVREFKRPVYPNGRYIIRVGDTILNPDEADQVWPFPKWPFVITPHYLLPHMWQGSDSVQLVKTTQDMINVSASHLVNNMKMFGDPKIAVEQGALATPPGRHKAHYKIGIGAGSIIRLVKGALTARRFQVLDPPNLSAGALQLYGLFTQEYKNMQGLQDISQGKPAKSGTTATEAQFLIISANDRIALQSVYEDAWIKQVASLFAVMIQKNYDVGRMVRIIGNDKIVGAQEISQELKEVRFDVDIIPGATLPFDEEKRIIKTEKAMAALQQPIANPLLPEYLRQLEIPNWKEVLQRYEAWRQFAEFAELYQAVLEGRINPEQAAQFIIQKMIQIGQGQAQTVEGIAAGNERAQNAS
jgi:hypothetical protein